MRRRCWLVILTTCVLAVGGVGSLVVSNNLLAAEPPDLSRYLLTKPQTLFSLPYGKGSSQVGMLIAGPEEGRSSGPSDFALGTDGSIYMGDQQNGKVKRFSRSGQLLMMTAERIDRIAGMTVDRHGKIYVIHGAASNEVAVYDDAGKRLPEIEQKIESAMEQLVSNQPELKRFRGIKRPSMGAVRCDVSGNVYFRGGQFTLKIGPQFTQAQVLKEHPLDEQGSHYSYRYLPPEKQVEGLVYGIDGSLVNRYLKSIAVLEYDDKGGFVGLRAVINGFTMPSIHWVEVDPQGNVYWLDYKADHVDVMMAPVP